MTLNWHRNDDDQPAGSPGYRAQVRRGRSVMAGGMRRPLHDPQKMRGMSMLEALVSVLLMSIMGLGIAYTIARASVAQLTMSVTGLSVSGMRSLVEQGTCLSAGSTVTIGSSAVSVACSPVTSVSYTISYNGATAANGALSLPSINTGTGLSTYYGGSVVINASQQ